MTGWQILATVAGIAAALGACGALIWVGLTAAMRDDMRWRETHPLECHPLYRQSSHVCVLQRPYDWRRDGDGGPYRYDTEPGDTYAVTRGQLRIEDR